MTEARWGQACMLELERAAPRGQGNVREKWDERQAGFFLNSQRRKVNVQA